ncbi:TetR/AcrR family transcriptional regulator [Acinetobacter sp. B10A]|uniref:TetR/AcrR family transcriptional regulator n=1 Tax=Acinetobacter baretiae TaxID=2605383 RepID=UPI001B3C6C08|nr:TetR/AcrR family transcriptional regulator [Acinetobacter baretiae]MBF7685683.1 TetR/AcrR family transcriptional regulator [Acinetobacter baretiae]
MSKSALKILNTAEKLFNHNSFIGVGVDFIRDESGCSKTTMYTHFKNKTQLIHSVLTARDQRFQHRILEHIGDSYGATAIHQILDWHMKWFQQDDFKGCLFIRAFSEATDHQEICAISIAHKQWVKQLITKHCLIAGHPEANEIIYTLIEGLISRFLIDGFDSNVAQKIQHTIYVLLSPPQHT